MSAGRATIFMSGEILHPMTRRVRRLWFCLLMTDDGMRHIRLFQVCNLFLVVAISTQIPTDARFASEETFSLLRDKFAWAWDFVPLSERVTNPAKGRYPDACFDGFLVRGAN